MCGRYYRKDDKQKIVEAFHVSKVDDFPLPPWDYNVAPTTMQPISRILAIRIDFGSDLARIP